MIVSTNKQEHNNMNEFPQNQTPFGFTPNKSRMASNYGTQGFISQSSKYDGKKCIKAITPKKILFFQKPNSKQLDSTQNFPIRKRTMPATKGDRFIPLRKNNDHQYLLFSKETYEVNQKSTDNNKENSNINANILINNAIIDSLLPNNQNSSVLSDSQKRMSLPIQRTKRLLSFSKQNSATIGQTSMHNSVNFTKSSKNLITDIKEIYETNFNMYQNVLNNENSNMNRKIPEEPERILDAPQLIDDYYLNLLDWGNQNILSVCLGDSVYLWNASTGHTSLLTKSENNENICSVNFMNNGSCLAVGLNNGYTELWDIERSTKIRNLNGHESRVSALAWNNYILSTGSKDSLIMNHDVRIKEHIIHKFHQGHTKEVCSIKWDLENNMLASGGNDNLVCIWDVKSKSSHNTNSIWNLIEHSNEPSCTPITPIYILNQHEAAVKALAWNPWKRGVLASGGGKKDHSIKFWNTENGTLINSYDTGSQVCQLIWNKYEKELISSHGYSKNQISIWSYPKMNKVVDLVGHMNRVLYLTMSPDGCTLVSGSSDETLRFWNINDKEKIKEYNQTGDIDKLNDFFSYINIR